MRNLNVYRTRILPVRDEQPAVPGVVALATPGHTIWHHVFATTSGGRTVINSGDLAHHHAVMLRRPAWEIAFDSDPVQSARSRARMLVGMATDRHALLSCRFPGQTPGMLHARAGSMSGSRRARMSQELDEPGINRQDPPHPPKGEVGDGVLAKPFDDAARGVMPFMMPLLGVLMLCTYVPEIVMYLPTRWYR